MMQRNSWIPLNIRKTHSPRIRLFCLPYAGGSSFAYRSIENFISSEIDMCSIELPGHGARINETARDRIEELIPQIAYGIEDHLDIPFAFFGHSMGALLAFELSHYLESHFQKKADYLFLSAMRAPHLPSKFPSMGSLSQKDFLERVKQLGELPENIIQSPEMLDMFLRIMRVDFALCENHLMSPRMPTSVPIFAFGGDQDSFAKPEDVEKWEQYTKGLFQFKLFPGGHLFCKAAGKEIAETINQILVKPLVELNGTSLTVEQLLLIANGKAKASITDDPQLLSKIKLSHLKMQQAVQQGETIYGVTTAFGGMANVRMTSHAAADLQQNMLWIHKTGVGKNLPIKEVRAAMALRANSHLRGNSSIRLLLIERLVTFLNEGVTPCVPEFGSIGASGDLVPLSYIAGALVGHNADYKVEMNGERISSKSALEKLQLPPLTLDPKEALAMLNGTSMMTAIGASCVGEAEELFCLVLNIQALLFQGLNGTVLSFHPFLHQNKPHPGQVWVAEKMVDLLEDSLLVRKNNGFDRNSENGLVQDRYSLRCLPQYLGPVFENLWNIKRQIEIEMNSSNDNPLMNPETGEIFYGGNFLGEYVGIGMDQLRMMVGLVAKGIDVQIALLVEPHFSQGLPACLVGNRHRSVNMGLKGLQIVGNSLLPLLEFYGNSIADRFPTHAEQFNQNINSQGFNSANLTRQSLEIFRHYLSLSLLFAVQSVDLRSHLLFGSFDGGKFLSSKTRVLYQKVREITERPADREKPWLWNDDEHRLDEQVARLSEDLSRENSMLKAASQ